MSDETQPEESVDTAETTAETDNSAAEETTEPKKPTETVEFWKSKARENEKRAKENATAAKRLAELEESQKSELQKAIERAEEAEGVAYALKAAQEINDFKAQVSKKTGVPVDVLRGSDLDEIEAHAASLKALLPEPRKPGQVPAEGRTVLNGSGDPAQQFAELIRNARRG
jgi:ribonuclease D